jgi:hypothetical protein
MENRLIRLKITDYKNNNQSSTNFGTITMYSIKHFYGTEFPIKYFYNILLFRANSFFTGNINVIYR